MTQAAFHHPDALRKRVGSLRPGLHPAGPGIPGCTPDLQSRYAVMGVKPPGSARETGYNPVSAPCWCISYRMLCVACGIAPARVAPGRSRDPGLHSGPALSICCDGGKTPGIRRRDRVQPCLSPLLVHIVPNALCSLRDRSGPCCTRPVPGSRDCTPFRTSSKSSQPGSIPQTRPDTITATAHIRSRSRHPENSRPIHAA